MSNTQNYTNTETFILPSKGMIYNKQINPAVELRSMTTQDEELRLRATTNQNKLIADLIDSCTVSQVGMSSYDMCLGDFNFLLYKLRIVTYGPEYKMEVTCPFCREHKIMTADLDSLAVNEYNESFEDEKVITLPVTQKKITLRIITPRDLDEQAARIAEIKKKAKDEFTDPTFKLSIQTMIDLIDGEKPSFIGLENFVSNMPMKDVNYLIQKSEKLNGKVGLDTELTVKCDQCGGEFVTSFRGGKEFFRPSVN